MKKEIYKLFTAENGIRMSAETLEHINSKINSNYELENLFSAFKSKFNSAEITVSHVSQITNQSCENKQFYKTHPFSYKPKNLSERYEFFKKYINHHYSPISMIEEQGSIYGIVYRNRSGNFVLEDDHDLIALEFDDVIQDAFIFENMFLCFEGTKINSKFSVKKIILPNVEPYKSTNNFLQSKPAKIGVLGRVDDLNSFIEKLSKYEIDILIASEKSNIKPNNSQYFNHNLESLSVIKYPCFSSGRFLPINHCAQNCVSNPFILELHDKKLSFIDCDLYKYKEEGIFLNKNHLESFFRSFISQYSLNPFEKMDLYYDEIPNCILITQDFLPFIIDISGITVISLPPVSENTFCLIDIQNNQVEMKNFD